LGGCVVFDGVGVGIFFLNKEINQFNNFFIGFFLFYKYILNKDTNNRLALNNLVGYQDKLDSNRYQN
jgi:hypothetical protein